MKPETLTLPQPAPIMPTERSGGVSDRNQQISCCESRIGRRSGRMSGWLRTGYGWWMLSLLWMGLIYFASAQSGDIALPISVNDKLEHLLIYAPLGYCLLRALSLPPLAVPLSHASVYVLVWVAIYGATDEWHQSFVAGRNVSLGDWFADVVGAALAVVWGNFLARGKASKSQ